MTPRVAEQLSAIADLVPGPRSPGSTTDGATASPGFASTFDVDTVAMASAAAAADALGAAPPSAAAVRAAFTGPVLIDDEPLPTWADLSGYYRTRDDRFVQFHCNFPHHAAGVVARLGCDPVRDAVQEAVLDWDPHELEAALIADGMIAARLRTLDEWAEHPHAVATADLPLISVERLGDAAPRPVDGPLRVLDCTRVLAGPVAGQTLAAVGADVLRIGAAHLPSVDLCVLVTGTGKRNAFLDLRDADDHATFAGLLAESDVWFDAYRPGAFDDHGFGLDAVPPGSVVVQLSAFDWVGPWAGRRGYDSIVQSTTGIVEAGRTAAGAVLGGQVGPTPLPVQALDYATGFLATHAAAKVRAHQAVEGGTWLVRLSLLRTRNWLVSLGGPDPFTPSKPSPADLDLVTLDTEWGRLTIPPPIVGEITTPPAPLGSSPPTWR